MGGENALSGLIYRMAHRVKGYECDVTGEITLPTLINLMIHVSGVQSIALGNTTEQMLERGVSWVIVQYDMKIERMPHAGEELVLQTQAVSYNRFFTYRQFKVFDANDQICLEVMVTFVMMDFESRKMVQIQKDLIAPYQVEEIRNLLRVPKPEKLEQEGRSEQEFRVRYLDIDYNRHVNNSKYLDWIINTLDPKFIMDHQMVAVNIKYEKEVEYGNVVKSVMTTSERENGEFVTAHQICNGEDLSCEAHIIWKKV